MIRAGKLYSLQTNIRDRMGLQRMTKLSVFKFIQPADVMMVKWGFLLNKRLTGCIRRDSPFPHQVLLYTRSNTHQVRTQDCILICLEGLEYPA